MDASKITELRQKQLTNYIHTRTPLDSSHLTWYKQTCSSRFMADNVKRTPNVANSCTQPTNYNQNVDCSCRLVNQSTLPPTTFVPGTGSASQVYTSDKVVFHTAGNVNTLFNPSSNMYISTPSCFCSETNIASVKEGSGIFIPPVGGFNPYLPLPHFTPTLRCGTTVTIGSGPQVPIGCVPARKKLTLCSTNSEGINTNVVGTVVSFQSK